MKSVITILLLSLLAACSGGRSGNTLLLERIDSLTSVNPAKAAALLDSIDPATLSEEERHYRDLLTIKAADKDYGNQTSDSLIFSVIDYYDSHPDSRLTPQALYYGGRVYSDLGDYPTALRYFQDALDHLPDNDDNLYFRGVVLSQIGRLLSELRLWSKSQPYLVESISISKSTKDNLGAAYDLELLGITYMETGNLNKADSIFNEAVNMAAKVSSVDSANICVYLADVQYRLGNIDAALGIVRKLPAQVEQSFRDITLACATDIYLAAGIADTAYMYAHELVNNPYDGNQIFGVKALTSQQLRNRVPLDSLLRYINIYRDLIERKISSHSAEEALIQNSRYNYNIHLRERLKAESDAHESNLRLCAAIICFIFLLMFLFAIISHFKYKRAKDCLKLYKANEIIRDLKRSLDRKESTNRKNEISSEDNNMYVTMSLSSMAEHLQKSIQEILSKLEDTPADYISPDVLKSEMYERLLTMVKTDKCITDGDYEIWQEIENFIKLTSPHFKEKLQILTIGKLRDSDYQLALLIKVGLTPVQTSILLNRTKATISTRRKALCDRIHDDKIDSQNLDGLIRLL